MASGRLPALLAAALLLAAMPAAGQQPAANPAPQEARLGWYASVSTAVGVPTYERALQRRLGVNVSTNETLGLDGRLGYRLHRNFAAELEVQWLNPFSSDIGTLCSSGLRPTQEEIQIAFPTPPQPTNDLLESLPCRGRELVFPQTDPVRSGDPFRIEPVVATLNGRAYLATGRWQPYLIFGSGIIHVDIRDKSTGFRRPNGQFAGGKDVDDFGFVLRMGGGLEYYITEQLVLTLGASYVLPISGRAQIYDYVSLEPFGLAWRFR